ncbi:S-layer domain containing protein [Leptolyngbyaceae cyanobacterium JSC-12]|nr:S-layer domain containing protein [Leptolyngbyaceae cyanobacterium JSC-12]
MKVLNRSTASFVVLSLLLVPLASCTNSSFGQALQDSLAADPKLTETAPNGNVPSPTDSPASAQAELPADFPGVIPLYPNATLQDTTPATAAQTEAETATIWQTVDASDRVFAFYRQQLQTNGWQIVEAPLADQQGTLVAQRDNLKLSVVISSNAPSPNPSPNASPTTDATSTGTRFTLRYTSPAVQIGQTPSPSPTATSQPIEAFLGAEGSSDVATGSTGMIQPTVALSPNLYTDLNKAPQELRRSLADLAQLGVLNLAATGKQKSATPANFQPNKPVSRREYARWLFEANNRLFRDRPAHQIRPANSESQPVFKDVPRTDPDFAAIQGLAEAGIIPSPLSGDLATVTFRPDAQLSREMMLLWKVPIDTRQPLPTVTPDSIKQTWGFQDSSQIDPKAQRAVLADYQNADLSNIRRVLGYTTLFQPKKPVTRAEAAVTLWYIGYQGDGISAQEALKGN